MKIYNTLTQSKEKFIPISKSEVKIYCCGPTVYNYIHIGNARPACVFDVLRRYLEHIGYKVNYVQNFTDLDDKIISKANIENLDSFDISNRYIKEYVLDTQGLNVMPANNHPKVTDFIDYIISFIEELVEKGFAYHINGDVYFKTLSYADYGKLSKIQLDQLNLGSRIELTEHKKNDMDFVLWKSAKQGEPSWNSKWGKGRPGWHIECSAMIKNLLGDTIDIHCGGQDLIFPHHENEIAQTESLTGKKLANYWMHNGYINIDNKKMSKSANNFFTVREIAEKYGYEPIRLMMIQSHYRTPINYSTDVIESCVSSLDRLYKFKDNLNYSIKKAQNISISYDICNILLDRKHNFNNAMCDDLNTALALAEIFELVKDVNIYLNNESNYCLEYLLLAKSIFNELVYILGILYNDKKDKEIPDKIVKLVEQRDIARKNKNYAVADKMRDEINSLGYILEETKQGTKISLKK